MTITNDHLAEWVKFSAVSEEITRLNVCSLTDPREIDAKLQRNAKSRTKHTDYGSGGWWVSGVDPLTGEPQGIGGQFKPDNPTDPKRKYLGISGMESAPLFLDVGDREYWQKILEGTAPIVITEGAKKAGSALSAGIPCVSISGVFNAQKNGKLKPYIANFCKLGRRIVLGFDSDQTTNPKVRQALDQLGRLIIELGSNVSVLQLPTETKGIDDYATAHGYQALAELVGKAIAFEEWRKSPDFEIAKSTPRKQQQIKNLRKIYADRLKLNLRGSQVELDGNSIKPDYLYLEALEKYGLDVGKEMIVDAFLLFAGQHQYDPVRDYLDDCYATYGDSTIELLENSATRYLGTTEPIYNTYLKKTLVGAVKRTYESGCKFDTATVFQGKQGLGKSTFWRILAGDEWFDDNVQGFEKDDKQLLHKYWIEELGEIEKISNKNDVSIIKSFLSRQFDNFRVPFGRTSTSFARKFIIVGSCNTVEFLQDATGDRRFWVIPLTQPIDLEAARIERDQLWAAAVALYKRGESVYLPKDLEAEREELNKQFRNSDPWEEAIASYLENSFEVKTTDILTNCLKMDIDRQDRRSQTRVAEVLRTLGWEKFHTMLGKVWRKIKNNGSEGSEGSTPYQTKDTPMTLISLGESLTVSEGSYTLENFQSSMTLTHHDPTFSELPEIEKTQKHDEICIKPQALPLKLGDRVEILHGQQYGKIAEIVAIADREISVKNEKWVHTREYAPNQLRVL